MAAPAAGSSGGRDAGREDQGEPGGRDEPATAAGEMGEAGSSEAAGFRRIPVELVDPSPFQPRQVFDEGALRQLADSISRSGMMQPIVVRPAGDHGGSGGGGARAGSGQGAERFELVAGERRLRAAKLAGLTDVPAIVREVDDESAAELALVENLQREDLNAIERARALRALCERFELTHAQVAERVGLERSSVTNLVRLLELEDEIVELLAQGMLGQGHGKALLSAPAGAGRIALAARAVREEWSVRRLEREARGSGGGSEAAHGPAPAKGGPDRPASLSELERQLSEHLGTKVRIAANSKGDRGRLTIEFYSLDHFDGLMGKIGFGMEG
jgi:ParB family chromosome partitioning protein